MHMVIYTHVNTFTHVCMYTHMYACTRAHKRPKEVGRKGRQKQGFATCLATDCP